MVTEAFPNTGGRRAGTETDDLVVAVAEAVAAAEDIDPTALDAPLAEHVDFDALDSLYTSASERPETTWTVEFPVDGRTVTVRSDGDITVS